MNHSQETHTMLLISRGEGEAFTVGRAIITIEFIPNHREWIEASIDGYSFVFATDKIIEIKTLGYSFGLLFRKNERTAKNGDGLPFFYSSSPELGIKLLLPPELTVIREGYNYEP